MAPAPLCGLRVPSSGERRSSTSRWLIEHDAVHRTSISSETFISCAVSTVWEVQHCRGTRAQICMSQRPATLCAQRHTSSPTLRFDSGWIQSRHSDTVDEVDEPTRHRYMELLSDSGKPIFIQSYFRSRRDCGVIRKGLMLVQTGSGDRCILKYRLLW